MYSLRRHRGVEEQLPRERSMNTASRTSWRAKKTEEMRGEQEEERWQRREGLKVGGNWTGRNKEGNEHEDLCLRCWTRQTAVFCWCWSGSCSYPPEGSRFWPSLSEVKAELGHSPLPTLETLHWHLHTKPISTLTHSLNHSQAHKERGFTYPINGACTLLRRLGWLTLGVCHRSAWFNIKQQVGHSKRPQVNIAQYLTVLNI